MATILRLNTPAQLTKMAAGEMSRQITKQVTDGYANPLEVLAGLTYLETVIKDALSAVRPLALDEADKYPAKTFDAFGVGFSVKETGVKYDYSDNKAWRDLQDNIDMLKAQQKGLETELRALKQCAKTSTTAVTVTLAK